MLVGEPYMKVFMDYTRLERTPDVRYSYWKTPSNLQQFLSARNWGRALHPHLIGDRDSGKFSASTPGA